MAGNFGRLVHYGWTVVRIAPEPDGDGVIRRLVVTAKNAAGERRELVTRNIVVAFGGRPNMLPGIVPASPRVIHSANFLETLDSAWADRSARLRVAVVGGGQSGAEVVHYLLRTYPNTTVDWVMSGPAPRPADDTPFVNDIFMTDEVDRHYEAVHQHGDSGYHRTLRNSNYGVADAELLYSLYRLEYDGVAQGSPQLHLHTRSPLVEVTDDGRRLHLRTTGPTESLDADLLVLATGYDRRLLPDMAGEVLPLLRTDGAGMPIVEREYRLVGEPELEAGIYVQGLAEHSHGLGDTLFPVMPFRSAEIAAQLVEDSQKHRVHGYPPARHREEELETLHEVIRRFPMATMVINVHGRPHACEIPMILTTSAGPNGTLFGHVDSNNPQAPHLEDGEMLAVFHGPNQYISSHVYAGDHLPTWNFVSVQVRGTARVIRDRAELVAALGTIAAHADPGPTAYRLAEGDPRIPPLIDDIVGFWLPIAELQGHLKLSQDRVPDDRERAKNEMIRANSPGTAEAAEFIDWVHERAVGTPEYRSTR